MAVEEMEQLVLGLGDQLRWAADVEAPAPIEVPGGLLIVGMGGSGISGDLVSVLASVPVTVHKGYGLPAWVSNRPPAMIALSYSGNTEETLSAVEEARDLGLTPGVVTAGGALGELAVGNGWPHIIVPGGLQPRAALGYMMGSLLRLVEDSVDLKPGDFSAAADLVDQLTGGLGLDLAADLAAGLRDRIPVIYGTNGLTSPVAQRWKTQINENAKWPAWWNTMPELDHNEIVSWTSLSTLTRRHVGIIALRDDSESSRVEARYNLTARLTGSDVAWVGEVWAQGVSRLERILSLCAMGDLVSLELARAGSIDPMAVPEIETLKQLLAEEPL
ncbi:bifunctional phosphoglucose/phosphomannose isomerase [soil metagenome]